MSSSEENNLENISKNKLRLLAIQELTGLKNLNHAFDYNINNTEIELLIFFLDRRHNFSLCEYEEDNGVYEYITNIIQFSPESLELIGANFKEFYDNLTVFEAVNVILNKLLDGDDVINSINGFPADLNISSNHVNKPVIYDNVNIYPLCSDFFFF